MQGIAEKDSVSSKNESDRSASLKEQAPQPGRCRAPLFGLVVMQCMPSPLIPGTGFLLIIWPENGPPAALSIRYFCPSFTPWAIAFYRKPRELRTGNFSHQHKNRPSQRLINQKERKPFGFSLFLMLTGYSPSTAWTASVQSFTALSISFLSMVRGGLK